jgi:hypothetical protein
VFAKIFDYGEDYRGAQKLVTRGNLSAGYVVKEYNPESWLNAHPAHSFCQIGGVWVNYMPDRALTEILIANGIEQWMRSPKLGPGDTRPETFHVPAVHHRSSEKLFLTDIFVFDLSNGALLEAILGISYVKVQKMAMSKMLRRLTPGRTREAAPATSVAPNLAFESITVQLSETATFPPQLVSTVVEIPKTTTQEKMKKQPLKADLAHQVKAILADLSGLEVGRDQR